MNEDRTGIAELDDPRVRECAISDADRNGTLRRLHNAVALGLIDIGEFEERSALVSTGPAAFRPRRPGRRSARTRRDHHARPPTGSNCAVCWAR